MTQTVRLLGRFMNSPEETLDVVCDTATAAIPPSHREIGAGGDVQISLASTAIRLWDVHPESMAALRKGTWTHILWSGIQDQPAQELQVRQIFVEGKDIRVLV